MFPPYKILETLQFLPLVSQKNRPTQATTRDRLGQRSKLRHFRKSAQRTRLVVSSPAMLGNRTSEQWIAQYSTSHQHPINRACHTLGIPLILLSVVLFLASGFLHRLWIYALALFLLGWIFQFIGTPSKASRPNSSTTGASSSSASAGGGQRSTAKPECLCGAHLP
jgi:hypothetical protein